MKLIGMANPFREYGDRSQAEKAAGIPFPLPKELSDCGHGAFRVIPGRLIENTFLTAKGSVFYRKGRGPGEDISGDYRGGKRHRRMTVAGIPVVLRGGWKRYLNAVWSKGEYRYALVFREGMPLEDALYFAEAIMNGEK